MISIRSAIVMSIGQETKFEKQLIRAECINDHLFKYLLYFKKGLIKTGNERVI